MSQWSINLTLNEFKFKSIYCVHFLELKVGGLIIISLTNRQVSTWLKLFFPQFGIFVTSLKMSNEFRKENAKKNIGGKKVKRERVSYFILDLLT
jgi:hypothetical protein